MIPTKYFNTEEEALNFASTIPNCSAVGHMDNKYYVSLPNILSETLYAEIDRVCQELDLKVSLGIEWITGANWYQCH